MYSSTCTSRAYAVATCPDRRGDVRPGKRRIVSRTAPCGSRADTRRGRCSAATVRPVHIPQGAGDGRLRRYLRRPATARRGLHEADLEGTHFDGVNLDGARFFAVMNEAVFTDTNLPLGRTLRGREPRRGEHPRREPVGCPHRRGEHRRPAHRRRAGVRGTGTLSPDGLRRLTHRIVSDRERSASPRPTPTGGHDFSIKGKGPSRIVNKDPGRSIGRAIVAASGQEASR